MKEFLPLLLFFTICSYLPCQTQSLKKSSDISNPRSIEFLLKKYSKLIQEAQAHTGNSTNPTIEPSNKHGKLESPCIENSIQLYNLSMDFQDTILLTSQEEEFEALMKNDVAQYRDHMTALETKLTTQIEQMETLGSDAVNDKNITDLDIQIRKDVEAVNNLLLPVHDKFSEVKKSIISKMEALVGVKNVLANLLTLYTECKSALNDTGIILSPPLENSEPVLAFNVSVLMEIDKCDRQLILLKEKMQPIIDKYNLKSADDIPEGSEDAKIFNPGLKKVTILVAEVKRIISENDNMLRHYGDIVHAALGKARDQIDIAI